jgi:hypothetical protein
MPQNEGRPAGARIDADAVISASFRKSGRNIDHTKYIQINYETHYVRFYQDENGDYTVEVTIPK